MKNTDFIKGQKFLCVYRERKRKEIKTIAKVGRKWITLCGGERFDCETRLPDESPYTSQTKIYMSIGDYNTKCEIENTYASIKDWIMRHRNANKGVTVGDLKASWFY